jgi:hypothetical protein
VRPMGTPPWPPRRPPAQYLLVIVVTCAMNSPVVRAEALLFLLQDAVGSPEQYEGAHVTLNSLTVRRCWWGEVSGLPSDEKLRILHQRLRLGIYLCKPARPHSYAQAIESSPATLAAWWPGALT